MKIGEVIESAIWLNGEESPQMRERYEHDVSAAMAYLCSQNNVIHGPITFVEKHPEADKVPAVPDHIQGIRVRLLVGESTIVEECVLSPRGSFVANLERKDLKRLRGIVREEGRKSGVARFFMSNRECDKIIEELGPDAALDTLRA